jgi:hypothetical protein
VKVEETQPASAEADSNGAPYVLSDAARQSQLAARVMQPKAKVLPKAQAQHVPDQSHHPIQSSGSQADAVRQREEEEEGASNWNWEEGWDWKEGWTNKWQGEWADHKRHRSE